MRKSIAFAVTLAPLAAHAVVATTSPYEGGSPDSTYAFVGQMSGASAVAIGPHLVLTAGHVGAGDFVLGTDVYRMTSTEIAPDWKKRDVDLRLVTVAETLPGWYTVGNSVKKGASVTMVGYGYTGVVKSDGSGYDLTTAGARYAGTDKISSKETTSGVGPTMRVMLNGAGDSVLTPGDSGGGWFSNGELVGISAFTYTKNSKKAAYGWSGTDYFGSGAIDLTNGLLNDWIDGQISDDLQFSVLYPDPGFYGGPEAVPEPGTFAALALGAVAFLRRRPRRIA